MKKVKMIKTIKKHKRRNQYEVTSRYADYLVEKGLAELVEKEEKVKPETKEEKPKAKTITKAVK